MARVVSRVAMVVMLSAPLCFVVPVRLHTAPVMWQKPGGSRRQQVPTSSTSSALSVAAVVGAAFLKKETGQHGNGSRILRATTRAIVPSLRWLKAGLRGCDLKPGEFRAYAVAGCDMCIGNDEKLFAVGGKVLPSASGTSLSVAAKVRGSKIWDGRFGSAFDCFTGQPEWNWCSALPRIGKFIARIIRRRGALQTFEIRERGRSGDIENSACKSWFWRRCMKADADDNEGSSNDNVQGAPCGRWCTPDYLSVLL